ncbi:MAG: glycosyltransferase [Plesiomonas sp.]|uniref:glycosyltransferase n=1 Tax=Plesiomonas sp. TaxID=2486279 RepID=UPI003F3295E3
MNIKKISIITLTYNNWVLLERAFESVSSQVVDKKYLVEYLIVDDGTVDFDKERINELLKKTSLNYNIIVNDKNIGTVASFNNAIKKSTGDIIIPLSADDVFFDSSVVMSIADFFEENDSLIVTGLRCVSDRRGERNVQPKLKERQLFDDNKKLLKRIMIRGNIISGASTYYNRAIFERLGYFDESYRLLEDYPFYIKALSCDIAIELLNRVCIIYSDDGVSNKTNISSALRTDFLYLHNFNIERRDLSCFEKRCIKFHRMMNPQERRRNLFMYPEQTLIWAVNKITTWIS